jgi:hypothetical protein
MAGAACWLLCCGSAASLAAAEFTLKLEVLGRQVEGTPLAWAADHAVVLQRDGQMIAFDPADVQQLAQPQQGFRSYSAAQMRRQLLLEFGPNYDVQSAGNYLVVHPRGSTQPWALRFDRLQRNFLHYFSTRGIRTARPRFPLVAVVLPNQTVFDQYKAREGVQLPPGCVGYYSSLTNRVVQFDQAATGRVDHNLALIIHEASHQVAFNLGVHHRGSPPPRWLSEGLGTMFEARGVWDAASLPDRKDRINRAQLQMFRRLRPTRSPQFFVQLLASDRAFGHQVDAAYAEAWVLTFYLAETDPRRFADYLQRTASLRRPLVASAKLRMDEFVSVYGSDFAMLEARLLRFVDELEPD